MIYVDNSSEYSQRIFIPRDESVAGADITGATYALQDKYYLITTNGETVQIRPDAGYDGISGGTITVRVQATGGTTYFAGTNIDIDENNVISVTGLTEAIENVVTGITLDYATTGDVETMISEAIGDFVTSGDVETMITLATSAFTTSADVITLINSASGFASTQYVDNAVSGKADTTAVTESISAATDDMATKTWVNEQGFLTEEQSLSAYSTTEETQAMITAATSALTTTGDVETMISSATSGLATTQDVENAVSGKADTTAVTESISSALTAYTPTSGFTTINGSAITEGGNIVIEGGSGGDSTSLEKITTLPENPVDGAVYNYNGVLIKYVNGAGKWGYWSGADVMRSYAKRAFDSATLFYGVIPASMDGELAFGLGWYNSDTGGTKLWGYFNLNNDSIDVYDNSGKTGTTLYTITRNASSETLINNSNIVVYVSWNDNVLQLNPANTYSQLMIPCDTSISTGHYELAQPIKRKYELTRDLSQTGYSTVPKSFLVSFDYDTGDVYPARELSEKVIYVNNSGYSSPIAYYSSSNAPMQRMFVPTTSGETGNLCVAQGASSAPVFKTVQQALGIDFWTGTQDEYDAITTKSATTLYIIIPDNS